MKKGFTLIELLAVIVILAIIALIAVPIVLNIINDSKASSEQRSIELYAKAVQNSIADYQVKYPQASLNSTECVKGDSSKKIVCNDIEIAVDYSGNDVKCGIMAINSSGNVYLSSCSVGNSEKIVMNGDEEYTYGTINLLKDKIITSNEYFPYYGDTYKTKNLGDISGYTLTNEGCYVSSSHAGFMGGLVNSYTNLNSEVIEVTAENCSSLPSWLSYDWENGGYREFEIDWGAYGEYIYTYTLSESHDYSYTNINTQDNKNTYYLNSNVTNNYVKFGGQYIYTYGDMWNGFRSYEECADNYTNNPFDYQLGNLQYCIINDEMNYDSGECATANVAKYCVDNSHQETKDLLWRIVRVNEDGSIRLVINESVGTGQFNSGSTLKYIGYMYGTDEDPYANTNDSTIKSYLDDWYENNLLNYSNYIADAGFCNERPNQILTSMDTWNSSSYFVCPNASRDLFTVNNTKGNQALKYPIGILTHKEASNLGISNAIEMPNYYMSMVFDTGNEIYPVINLKSTIPYTSGSGTIGDPYIVG